MNLNWGGNQSCSLHCIHCILYNETWKWREHIMPTVCISHIHQKSNFHLETCSDCSANKCSSCVYFLQQVRRQSVTLNVTLAATLTAGVMRLKQCFAQQCHMCRDLCCETLTAGVMRLKQYFAQQNSTKLREWCVSSSVLLILCTCTCVQERSDASRGAGICVLLNTCARALCILVNLFSFDISLSHLTCQEQPGFVL